MVKNEVFLQELAKSDKFIQQVNMADEETSKSGVEHGFRFCKKEHKLLMDKLCKGDECTIDIRPEKCDRYDDVFHVHPDTLSYEHSPADLSNLAIESNIINRPRISCVKGEYGNIIECIKINPPSDRDAIGISLLNTYYDKNRTKENRILMEREFYETLKPDKMLIHTKRKGYSKYYKYKDMNKR